MEKIYKDDQIFFFTFLSHALMKLKFIAHDDGGVQSLLRVTVGSSDRKLS